MEFPIIKKENAKLEVSTFELCKTPNIGNKIKFRNIRLENQEKIRIERLEKEKQELKMENIK